MPAEQSARGVSLERWSPDGWALRPTTLRAYVVAVLLIAGSLLVVWMFRAWFGGNVPYLQFFPAILIAAWYGGLGPGTLATVLSALAAMYFFLPPPGLAVGGVPDVMSLGFFVATGLGISWLKHQLRAAAVLSASRAERLDGIINTTVDGIIVIDAVGRIEAFNRGAERLFGYPQSEVLGRNVSMLMPFPYHEEHTSYLTRFLATGDAGIIGKGREVTGRRRDGTVFPLHLSVGEMTVGGQRKFTGMLHDLTERVRLEGQLGSSEARWRAIIDSAVDGIIVIDAHGRVETFNPAAERLFGYSAEEVLGRNVDMLMPSPYREEHDSYLARYLATGRARLSASDAKCRVFGKTVRPFRYISPSARSRCTMNGSSRAFFTTCLAASRSRASYASRPRWRSWEKWRP